MQETKGECCKKCMYVNHSDLGFPHDECSDNLCPCHDSSDALIDSRVRGILTDIFNSAEDVPEGLSQSLRITLMEAREKGANEFKQKVLERLPLFNRWNTRIPGSHGKNVAVEDEETGRNPVLRETRTVISNLEV